MQSVLKGFSTYDEGSLSCGMRRITFTLFVFHLEYFITHFYSIFFFFCGVHFCTYLWNLSFFKLSCGCDSCSQLYRSILLFLYSLPNVIYTTNQRCKELFFSKRTNV